MNGGLMSYQEFSHIGLSLLENSLVERKTQARLVSSASLINLQNVSKQPKSTPFIYNSWRWRYQNVSAVYLSRGLYSISALFYRTLLLVSHVINHTRLIDAKWLRRNRNGIPRLSGMLLPCQPKQVKICFPFLSSLIVLLGDNVVY